MADRAGRQISKPVLGQTMTVDEGASLAQSRTHEEVRQDIADSDIMQAVDTLNAALVVPYINLNFGEQKEYPKLDLFKPDEKNIGQIITAAEKLGPQGLKVKADELRSLIGLSNPEDGDETIGGRSAYAPQLPDGEPDPAKNIASNSETPLREPPDEAAKLPVDELIDGDSGYIAISDDIADVIQKAADASTDFETFRAELEKPVKDRPPGKTAECVAVAAFKARALGDAEFSDE
jgi:phage gp29-like protein